MSRNTADWYDLDAARAASRRLTGLPPLPGGADDDSAYVRLPERAGAHGVVETVAEPELQSFTTWDEYLAWAMEFTGAGAGFAVDPQGFVIGTAGERGPDGFEGLGAELSYVVGQATGMAEGDEILDGIGLVFSGRMVVGFRSPVAGAEGFIVAFVNPVRYDGRVRNQLFSQLEANVDHLR